MNFYFGGNLGILEFGASILSDLFRFPAIYTLNGVLDFAC